MTDESQRVEANNLLSELKPLMSQAEEMNKLDEEKFDSRKARVLLAKLNRTIDSLSLFRSTKTHTGLSEFASTIHPTLIKAENIMVELNELINIALDRNKTQGKSTKEPPQPANLPRNLEIKIDSRVMLMLLTIRIFSFRNIESFEPGRRWCK